MMNFMDEEDGRKRSRRNPEELPGPDSAVESRGGAGGRLRIYFTFDDVMNFRLLQSVGPAAESLFALMLLGGAGERTGHVGGPEDAFAQWRKNVVFRHDRRHDRRLTLLLRTGEALAEWPESMSLACSPSGRTTARFDPPEAAGADRPVRLDMLANHRLAVALRAFTQTAVQPYWPRIQSHLDQKCESSGRAMARGGMEALFATLAGEGLRWRPSVLSMPSEQPREVRLRGRGLLLAPSLFLTGPPRLFLDERTPGNVPVLVHAARPAPSAAVSLWGTGPRSGDGAVPRTEQAARAGREHEQPLAPLVGSTRSAVLQALVQGLTTTELAHHVGVSPGSASQHASVLRNAGLVSTTRTPTSAIHTLTPLGEALLRGPWLTPGRQGGA
jgi:DNA-binding transcriptional ArsR family regulator